MRGGSNPLGELAKPSGYRVGEEKILKAVGEVKGREVPPRRSTCQPSWNGTDAGSVACRGGEIDTGGCRTIPDRRESRRFIARILAAREGPSRGGSDENLGPNEAVHKPSQWPSSIIFDFPQVGKGVDVDMPSSRNDDPGLVDIEACIAALDVDIGQAPDQPHAAIIQGEDIDVFPAARAAEEVALISHVLDVAPIIVALPPFADVFDLQRGRAGRASQPPLPVEKKRRQVNCLEE
jgi:hypothetical protein